MGVGGVVDVWEEYLVGRLVEYAGNAQHEHRPSVGQHAAHQAAVEHIAEAGELAAEAQRYAGRAGQVDVEGVANVGGPARDVGQGDEAKQVEGYVNHDEEQLEGRKLYGALHVPEVGERYALEGVDGHGHGHHPHVRRMVGVAHEGRQRPDEGQHQRHEGGRGGSHAYEDGGVDALWVFALFVGKTEEGGLHAVGEYDKQQGRVGIHVGYHTVTAALGRQLGCVEWHEQVVEKPTNYARQSVDGRILGQ